MSLSGLGYINATYGTDFRKGDSVVFEGDRFGEVVGARNAHVLVRFGCGRPLPLHPTWELINYSESERSE